MIFTLVCFLLFLKEISAADVTIDVVQTPEGVYYIQSGSLSALPPIESTLTYEDNNDLFTGKGWLGFMTDAGRFNFHSPPAACFELDTSCASRRIYRKITPTTNSVKSLSVRSVSATSVQLWLPVEYSANDDLSGTAFLEDKTFSDLELVDGSSCFYKYDSNDDGEMDVEIVWNVYTASLITPDVTIDVVETSEGVYYMQSGSLPLLPPGDKGSLFEFIQDGGANSLGVYSSEDSGSGDLCSSIPESQILLNIDACVSGSNKATRPTSGATKPLVALDAPSISQSGLFLPKDYTAGDDLTQTTFYEGKTLNDLGLVDESNCFFRYDADADGSLDVSIVWNVYVASEAPSTIPSSDPSETPSRSVSPSSLPSTSSNPSLTPSVSNEPSISPTNSKTPSSGPSMAPSSSVIPSSNPSVSNAPSAEYDITIDVVETTEGVYYIQSGALSKLPLGEYDDSVSIGGSTNKLSIGPETVLGVAADESNAGRYVLDFEVDLATCISSFVSMQVTPTSNSVETLFIVNIFGDFSAVFLTLPKSYSEGDDLGGTAFFEGKTLVDLGFADESTCFFKYDSNGNGIMDIQIAWNVYTASANPSLAPSDSSSPSFSPSFSNVPSKLPSVTPSLSNFPSQSPSLTPSFTSVPSQWPSVVPSVSNSPSVAPSELPTNSVLPSSKPSDSPSTSKRPSYAPSFANVFKKSKSDKAPKS